MSIVKSGKKNKLNQVEILLVIVMLFSPFTALRIGSVGVTEVSVMLFSIVVLLKANLVKLGKGNYIFTRFWIIFLFLSTFGLFYNYVIRGHMSGTPRTMLFDYTSYLAVTLTCFALEIELSNKKSETIWKLIKRIYLSTSVVMLFLYVTSNFTNTVLGQSLNYYHLFRPLASNVHHTSMAMAPLPFIGMKLLFEEKNKVMKIIWLCLITSNLLIASATGSLKVVLGFIVGLILFSYHLYNKKINSFRTRAVISMILVLLIIIFVVYFNSRITKNLFDFFIAEDLSGARLALYSSSVLKILRSPIVGYGPGPHAEYLVGNYYDAHQTVLTIGLQGGVFAVFIFFGLIVKIFNSYGKDPYIVGSASGILLYILGGDILRRLPMWIFLTLFYYYTKQNSEKILKEGDLNE